MLFLSFGDFKSTKGQRRNNCLFPNSPKLVSVKHPNTCTLWIFISFLLKILFYNLWKTEHGNYNGIKKCIKVQRTKLKVKKRPNTTKSYTYK